MIVHVQVRGDSEDAAESLAANSSQVLDHMMHQPAAARAAAPAASPSSAPGALPKGLCPLYAVAVSFPASPSSGRECILYVNTVHQCFARSVTAWPAEPWYLMPTQAACCSDAPTAQEEAW